MSGLFGTFNIAKSGLFAQQRAVDVTSHNISNANTEGYSRQRVELETSRPFPMPNANNAVGPGQLGTGVNVASIDRIRDSFLDYQVRTELGAYGHFKGRDKFLSEIENILNEPSDTSISKGIGNFFDSWNTLATSAKESNSRSMVAQSALTLANDLNSSYAELQKLKENTQMVIKDSVFDINSMLTQLNQINQEIVQVKVAGNNPNDLMDRRDLLLDRLSSKFGMNINKRKYDGIDVTTSNEGINKGVGDDGNPPKFSDGTTANLVQTVQLNQLSQTGWDKTSRFSYVSAIEPVANTNPSGGTNTYKVTYYKGGDMTSTDNKVEINVNMTDEQCKSLDECRVLWGDNSGLALKGQVVANGTDKTITGQIKNGDTVEFGELLMFKSPTGELKGYMSVQTEIDTYEDQLNKFAKALAFSVNGILSQNSGTAADSANNINNFFINGEKKGVYSGTSIADITSAEQEITAGNITVSKAILDNSMLIKTGAKYDENGKNLSGESDGTRAIAIAKLRDRLMKVQDIDSTTKKSDYLNSSIFVEDSTVGSAPIYIIKNDVGGMTLDSYFKDTVDKLGIKEQEAKKTIENKTTSLAGFKESRDSVSGVSLDEEMANLVQFQHCYQANAKVISTVDQLLEVVINGLKR